METTMPYGRHPAYETAKDAQRARAHEEMLTFLAAKAARLAEERRNPPRILYARDCAHA
jgi:hypothetical protein